MASSARPIPETRRPDRTVAIVSTHCTLRNWAEKRLYEPLVGHFRLHAVYWDRGGLLSPKGREEAERYEITVHEYENPTWNLSQLVRYFGWIVRELDAIQAADGLDYVIACDTDVLPAIIWHRWMRGGRYRIYREEVDYYAGSRNRGMRTKERLMRGAYDAIEALLHTQCDIVFTLNRHAANRLRAWGVPERKLVIGGLWKKDEYFQPDREGYKRTLLERGVLTPDQYEHLKGRVVVSFCGLFYEFTHLKELLDSVAKFPNDVALILAGKGKDQPLVEDYCRRYPHMMFFGWKDEDEIKDFYRITDIVYQPLNPDENINWKYFGSTNKTFESLAAGCLFIGSAINERVDLNAQADFAVLLDFDRDLEAQLDELFRAIIADREVLRRRQRNARLLYETYNHENFKRIWLPLFEAGGPRRIPWPPSGAAVTTARADG
jgi:hypothetical protein